MRFKLVGGRGLRSQVKQTIAPISIIIPQWVDSEAGSSVAEYSQAVSSSTTSNLSASSPASTSYLPASVEGLTAGGPSSPRSCDCVTPSVGGWAQDGEAGDDMCDLSVTPSPRGLEGDILVDVTVEDCTSQPRNAAGGDLLLAEVRLLKHRNNQIFA